MSDETKTLSLKHEGGRTFLFEIVEREGEILIRPKGRTEHHFIRIWIDEVGKRRVALQDIDTGVVRQTPKEGHEIDILYWAR